MISLAKETLGSFAYRRDVCKRFVTVAPFRFVIDVLVNFAKSILELLVFILPIKVVLILAAPEMPSLFDRFFPDITKMQWAGILTVLVVLVHIFVLLGDWYLRRSLEMYAKKFSAEHKKGKFSDGDFLKSVYSGIVDARGGSLLVVLLGVAIGAIYTEFLLFFLAATVIAALLAIGVASISDSFGASFLQQPHQILGRLSGLIFISSFCYIVSSFVLFAEPPAFLNALVSIILARRLLGALNQKVTNLVWFHKKRSAIQKLFYRGHSESAENITRSRALVDSISQPELFTFAARSLDSLGLETDTVGICGWVESPFSSISFIECTLRHDGNEEAGTQGLLKIYEPGKVRSARKELEIYPYLERLGVIPKFIGLTEIDGYQIHVFAVGRGWSFTREKTAFKELYRKIAQIDFDADLVDEYCSEHPILTDRVTPSLLARMWLVADREEERLLDKFLSYWPEILQLLESLPLKLVIPEPALRQLAISDQGDFCLLGIGDWRIEPLGFAIRPKGTAKELISWLENPDVFTGAIGNDDLEFRVSLCSQIAVLEKCCCQGQLRDGISIVSDVMSTNFLRRLPSRIQAENELAYG